MDDFASTFLSRYNGYRNYFYLLHTMLSILVVFSLKRKWKKVHIKLCTTGKNKRKHIPGLCFPKSKIWLSWNRPIIQNKQVRPLSTCSFQDRTISWVGFGWETLWKKNLNSWKFWPNSYFQFCTNYKAINNSKYCRNSSPTAKMRKS